MRLQRGQELLVIHGKYLEKMLNNENAMLMAQKYDPLVHNTESDITDNRSNIGYGSNYEIDPDLSHIPNNFSNTIEMTGKYNNDNIRK